MLKYCPALFVALISSTPAMAAEALMHEPFAVANRNPFIQIYGLPDTEAAWLAARGEWKTALQVDAMNMFSSSSRDGDDLWIDGETYRATVRLRYGVTDNWELGVELPYISHHGGFMDEPIESFHDTFDLANADREKFPQDQLLYNYFQNGQRVFTLDESGGGLGDVRVSAGYTLAENHRQQWALRGGVKLPTGDAEDLTGSEGTDVSLALHFSDSQWLDKAVLSFHTHVGLLWLGDGEVIDHQREDWVIYGSASTSWQWRDSVALKVQLDGQSHFYDSSARELGRESLQLLLGGSYCGGDERCFDFSISEDLVVNTAPDVVFQLALRNRW